MRIITIDVTPADIDASDCIREQEPGMSGGGNCPVTRAAIRAGLRNPWTTKHDLHFGGDTQRDSLDSRRGVPLPRRAVLAIKRYDRTGEMRPFSFQIGVPDDL